MKTNKYAAVIGAANIDIGGTPYNELIYEDSNPGKITISYGGVGRNIAHNLIHMGVDVKLITATGSDSLGKQMLDHCASLGMDVSCSFSVDKYNSSIYLYINDERGDMKLALSDMDVCNYITPDYLEKHISVIRNAGAVVADCNLSHETLMYIKNISKAPVFVDTVSVNKSYKIKNNLSGFYAVKPNRIEAEYLTDIELNSVDDYIEAADKMISQGLKSVFISMGSEGMLAADRNNIYIVDHYNADIQSTTGAGDSSTAAIVWSYLNNNGENYLLDAAKAANAAASMTLRVKEAINKNITAEKINELIRNTQIKVRKLK